MSLPRALVAVYPIFFLSGVSGLLYQVVWVRWFGRVFGNTLYSAALVTAVFMGGLGLGSYLGGVLIDRLHERRGHAFPLKAYAFAEVAIAAIGLGLAFLLPALEPLSASISEYRQGPDGWYTLTAGSYGARYLVALLLLLPVTTIMGATLTLLIRLLLRSDLGSSGWRVGVLYGFNTAGAALGALLSDFLLVPAVGLMQTQFVAVVLNLIAAVAALRLVGRLTAGAAPPVEQAPAAEGPSSLLWLTGIAIALSGFAAMGIEILWFRHLTIALGGLRSVFSLLLTVMLVGMWWGSMAGGALQRRFGHGVRWYMLSQAGLVVCALGLLYSVPMVRPPDPLREAMMEASGLRLVAMQTLYNLKTVGWLVGPPALLMGFAYPLANAHVQRVAGSIGRRAGALYFANTLGAVLGSLGAGLVLLPALGMHHTATLLATAAAVAIVPLMASLDGFGNRVDRGTAVACLAVSALAVGLWAPLPSDHMLLHGIRPGHEVLTLSEGPNELVTVTESPEDGSRALLTNGHPMSATQINGQRYMRAFTHLPLMQTADPTDVLVICFGVGSTVHSASLHPSVERIEIADLSRNVLSHHEYFAESNQGVLNDPRVSVFVNDGRQHLRMREEGRFDLITLEPPPLRHAGVASLYTREFYELSRTRLKDGGFMAQWLPAYQVPEDVVRSIVRAFVDVFPNSVLLSGERRELILLGTTGEDRIRMDLERVQAAMAGNDALRADLERIHLGTPTEIIGTYLASAEVMLQATEGARPVTDDWPIMEYSAHARAQTTRFPKDMVAPWGVQGWCRDCFVDDRLAPGVETLGDYLQVLNAYYSSDAFLVTRSYMPDPGGFFTPAGVDLARLADEGTYLERYFGIGDLLPAASEGEDAAEPEGDAAGAPAPEPEPGATAP